jgi:hypothetical protein
MSERPPLDVAMTGKPDAQASTAEIPNASAFDVRQIYLSGIVLN